MLSLGSAGALSQIVSGFVVLYSRAIRVGDFVRIDDKEGTVIDIGLLSLKLLTRLREEITIPNAVVAAAAVNNYTRQSRESGLLVATSVTIGYDTPWRQVHALLELAASRTPELLPAPKPYVLETGLSDFYVVYQLNAAIAKPSDRPFVLSRLHGEIHDAFNEFGVQIMSPNFEAQPDGRCGCRASSGARRRHQPPESPRRNDWHAHAQGAHSAKGKEHRPMRALHLAAAVALIAGGVFDPCAGACRGRRRGEGRKLHVHQGGQRADPERQVHARRARHRDGAGACRRGKGRRDAHRLEQDQERERLERQRQGVSLRQLKCRRSASARRARLRRDGPELVEIGRALVHVRADIGRPRRNERRIGV